VRERVDSLLGGRSLLSVSLLTPARVRELVERMLELDPTLIDGDAEALAFLAPHVLARTGAGARSRGPRPRAVLSGGQRLGDAERRAVERAFGCPVFDQYSSAEFSVIAHECEEHTGLHVASEGYVVEILVGDRPARAGEVGDVVITDLNNRCLPFLRYAIGDRARAVDDVGGAARAACPCGRHSPRLSDLHGATPLVVQSESGHALLGGFVAHSIKDLGYAIKRCRVEPLGPRELRLWITRGGRYSEDVVRGLVATLERHLGGEVRVSVELEGAT
jgi:phenylacetate-CoA ligase